jgi:hypothetical protein
LEVQLIQRRVLSSNNSTTDIGRVIRFCLPAKIDDDFQIQAAGFENDKDRGLDIGHSCDAFGRAGMVGPPALPPAKRKV